MTRASFANSRVIGSGGVFREPRFRLPEEFRAMTYPASAGCLFPRSCPAGLSRFPGIITISSSETPMAMAPTRKTLRSAVSSELRTADQIASQVVSP